MSWTDKKALETICKLRDEFEVNEFIETGTYKGVNAQFQAKNFNKVMTCESELKYFQEARERLKNLKNVEFHLDYSRWFLRNYTNKYKSDKRTDIPIFYLDAHFYNPNGPRWVVKHELEQLKGMNNSIIIIHDFDNGLGHIVYDNQPLDMKVVGGLLKKVNPDFRYYTNTEQGCDIMKPEETNDPVIKQNLEFAWSKPDKGKRGILYCLPSVIELNKVAGHIWTGGYDLKEWKTN